MFDLSFEKLLVIGVIALFVIGPERLPAYAKKLGEWVRIAKSITDGAKSRIREEMGPEFDDVDWQKLDPRQYDPRRIIRESLLSEPELNTDLDVGRRTSTARPVFTDRPAAAERTAAKGTAGTTPLPVIDDDAT